MKRSRKIISSTLERIKQDFDPAYSYVIFERAGPADKAAFREVFEVLNRLNLSVHDVMTVHDPDAGKMLLVVKFDAGRTDGIMEEIFNSGLPKDVIFYGYGSSLSG